MAVSATCLRYLVFVVVVLYGLSGLAVCVGGGLLLGQLFPFREVLRPAVVQICWVLAGMGLAAVVNGVLGWRAVAKRSTSLIRTFVLLVVLVILVQLSTATWALVERTRVEDGVAAALQSRFDALDAKTPAAVRFWDQMQAKLECCGVIGPANWVAVRSVPWSCCAAATEPHEPLCARVHQRGCPAPLTATASSRLAVVAAVAAAASLAQSGAALLSCLLAAALAAKKRDRRSRSTTEAVPLRVVLK